MELLPGALARALHRAAAQDRLGPVRRARHPERRFRAFTLEEDLEIGSWLDLGIFIGGLAIAARGRGLDTCAQAAFADFHTLIRPLLGIPDNQVVICGMALGYADADALVNRLATDRAPVPQFASFDGFED